MEIKFKKFKKLAGSLRDYHCGELASEKIGETVKLCGWVNKYRDLGGLHFIDIRDKYGITQLGFDQATDEVKAKLKDVSLESVILAEGEVIKRPSDAINKKMITGEIELQVTRLEILSKCEEPPFLPHGQIEATEDLRLRYRYLDLRSKKLQNILHIRSEFCKKTRDTLLELGFSEIETPILYKTTPEGARDYIVPSRVHPNKVYALPQSPQTLKQLLMIGGSDKYFQISKCFRDEDLRADRQPEFTQVDIESSFATIEYIRNLAEELIKVWFSQRDDFKIQVMDYKTCLELYGSDKPDLRFDLKHHIVTDVFNDSAFSLLADVAKAKGMIKALFIPEEMGTFTRKVLDGLVEVVKPHGGKGVAWFKAKDGKRTGGVSKFITDEIHPKLGFIADGTWLFIADKDHKTVHNCADALRRHLGKQFNLIGDEFAFLWVSDFPLFNYDKENNRLVAEHHPFCMINEEDTENFFSDDIHKIRECRAASYDVVCNGHEIASGSIRIHDSAIQKRLFECMGLDDAEIENKFGFFIEALKYGTPPHAGIAFGLDRMIMLLTGTDNIKDVIAFPKTTSASDLMAQAPSVPAEAQTKDLHFKWRK